MTSSSSSGGGGGDSKGKEVAVDPAVEEEVATRFGQIRMPPTIFSGGTSKGTPVTDASDDDLPAVPKEGDDDGNDDPSRVAILVASDGTRFEVPPRVWRLIEPVRRILNEAYDGPPVLPLDVAPDTLSAVLDYCHQHASFRGSPRALREWDVEYARKAVKDKDRLYWLLMASNYLHVQGLLELLVEAIADIIRGKSAEEMRRMFNIENDLGPEEVQRWKDMNPWAFEEEEEEQ